MEEKTVAEHIQFPTKILDRSFAVACSVKEMVQKIHPMTKKSNEERQDARHIKEDS